jgi:hypothetical protein
MELVRLDRLYLMSQSVRGVRVWRDAHLGPFYRLSTSRINEVVSRNRPRFPPDFAFRVSWNELDDLKREFGIVSPEEWGGIRHSAQYFSEEGALMLANVLRSPTAIEDSIQMVRAFVQLRRQFAPVPPIRPPFRKSAS